MRVSEGDVIQRGRRKQGFTSCEGYFSCSRFSWQWRGFNLPDNLVQLGLRNVRSLYLGRSVIYEAIRLLTEKNGPLITGNFNKRKGDKTTWYALRDEDTADLVKKKPLYFRVEDAGLYGIPAAVLLTNLAYHINHNSQNAPGYRFQALSASRLAEILPFSRSTIQRALKHLIDEGVLLFRTTTDTTQPTDYHTIIHS